MNVRYGITNIQIFDSIRQGIDMLKQQANSANADAMLMLMILELISLYNCFKYI